MKTTMRSIFLWMRGKVICCLHGRSSYVRMAGNHPGNKKQSVPLALAIFHEATTAAFESYFPEREDASKFLKMINTWWLICNSKEMSHPNPLGNAVRVGDGKTDFLEALADWLEKWHDDCPAFTLTSKTSYALVLTFRAQSGLIKELLSEGL